MASTRRLLCVRIDALDSALRLHKQAETDTDRAEALGISFSTMWRLRKDPHIATKKVVNAVTQVLGDKYQTSAEFFDSLFELRDVESP